MNENELLLAINGCRYELEKFQREVKGEGSFSRKLEITSKFIDSKLGQIIDRLELLEADLWAIEGTSNQVA